MKRFINEPRKRRFPITEEDHGGIEDDAATVMPNLSAYPDSDGYYNFYRMSVHAASFPDKPKIAANTDVANNPISTSYTEVEQKMIDDAARYCGFRPKRLASSGSKEPSSVHTKSPVNNWRSIYK